MKFTDIIVELMKQEGLSQKELAEKINVTEASMSRYIKGESYVTIAEKLDAPVKSIDNAIQRIRKKAIRNIANGEE